MTPPPFQALLDEHGRDVHRFLIATVGRADADDCYQETWLAALRAYPALRDAANLRGWLLRIAHNKAIDHVRAGARRPMAVGEVAEVADRAAARPGRAAATDGPTRADLDPDGPWGRVAELPPKQRAALALRFITDASYAEIGVAMETSEEAARRNVFEGLRRLRKELS